MTELANARDSGSHDKPVASEYTLRLEVWDKDKMVSWISSYLPEGLSGTTARHIAIYKDKEGKLQQIAFWGEMSIMLLEAQPTTKGEKK